MKFTKSLYSNVKYLLVIMMLCGVTSVLAQQAEVPTAWPPQGIDGLGVSVHFIFRNIQPEDQKKTEEEWFTEYDRQLDQIADMGLKIVRMDNTWRWTDESKSKYDFKLHHKLVEACSKRGLRVLTILSFCHPLYEKTHSIRSKDGQQSFAEFCARMVKEFKGKGVIWEMWNEPNLLGFWKPKANPKEYSAAMKMAIEAMRKVDPDCIIMAPSPCTFDFTFLESCFKQGLLEHLSAVSIHPYSDTPETQLSRYLQLRNMIDHYKPQEKKIPILCSEWGFSRLKGKRVRSLDEQAALVTRSILVDMMAGTPMHIIYTNRDYNDKLEWNETSFGLITFDNKPKSAYHAVKTLTSQLRGLKFEKQLLAESGTNGFSEVPAGDYVAVFTRGKKSVAVAWSSSPSHKVRIKLPGLIPVSMVDMKGNSMSIPLMERTNKALPDILQMQLTQEPVYILMKQQRIYSIFEENFNGTVGIAPDKRHWGFSDRITMDGDGHIVFDTSVPCKKPQNLSAKFSGPFSKGYAPTAKETFCRVIFENLGGKNILWNMSLGVSGYGGKRILVRTDIGNGLWTVDINNGGKPTYYATDVPRNAKGTWSIEWYTNRVLVYYNGKLKFDSKTNMPTVGEKLWDIPVASMCPKIGGSGGQIMKLDRIVWEYEKIRDPESD